jgi:hypothetical protein
MSKTSITRKTPSRRTQTSVDAENPPLTKSRLGRLKRLPRTRTIPKACAPR